MKAKRTKSELSLTYCDICDCPMVLYPLTPDLIANVPPSQGPNTAPWVKRWCGGYCYGITMPLTLEVDSLLTLSRKAKSKGVRKLARIVAKRLEKIEAEQRRDLKRMMQVIS